MVATELEDILKYVPDVAQRYGLDAERAVAVFREAAEAYNKQKMKAVAFKEPIILSDIVLYGSKGEPAITYQKIILSGEGVMDSDGKYKAETQNGWIAHFKESKNGRVVPSLPLLYAIIMRLQEEGSPFLNSFLLGILHDLRVSRLCTSTRINYENCKIIHNYGFEPYEINCEIPLGSCPLSTAQGKKWENVLQALFMPKDLDKTFRTLCSFSYAQPSIWTPTIGSRRNYPERAVWLGANNDRLDIGCNCRPGDGGGRSREVCLKK